QKLVEACGGIHLHPASRLNERFEDERGYISVFRQLGKLRDGLLLASGCGKVNEQGLKKKREEGFSEESALAHGHRSEGITMVSPFDGDHFLLRCSEIVPILNGHFQGHLHRRAAIIGKEHTAERTREHLQKIS